MNFKNLKLSSFFKKEFLLLYLIILVGAFLRLWGVFTNSFAFTYDVGRDMLALWDIVHLIKIPLIGATTGINGVFYGPWWYYLLTPFFFIFSGNPQAVAFLMALIGILSIFIGFYFGKKLGDTFLGITLAALISVSPNLISLSAQIWNPNIAPLFVLLTLFSLYKIYSSEKGRSDKYFLVLGILLLLNIDIEILWGSFFALGIIVSLIIVLNKKLKIKQVAYFLLGALIIALPRIIFELRHGLIMTKSFLAFLSAKNSLEDAVTFRQLIENRYFTFLDQFSSSLALGNQTIGLIFLAFIVLSLSIFYKKAPEIIKKFIFTAVSILVVFIVGTIIFSRALWPHYLVGLPIIYIFLFLISLYLLRMRLANLILPGFILLALFTLNLNPPALMKSFTSPEFVGNASLYRNQLAVVDYVYKEADGKDFKYVVYTPPVFDYTYRYLFKWYGPNKYGYLPNEEARTAFFIIEPDPGYEDRPKWWLEARKNDGKIIKSETLKGRIVVQTRIH